MNSRGRGPVDPRLLRYASSARGYLVVTVALGLAGTGLIRAQASLLAHALATAARGDVAATLAGTLVPLLVVMAARAAMSHGGEVTALRAAATVKSQLRRALTAHSLRLGPLWLGGQRAGEIATLSTRGLDGLDSYFARYLPQLVLAVLVPIAVLARVAAADWISAVVIAVTLPLIPVSAGPAAPLYDTSGRDHRGGRRRRGRDGSAAVGWPPSGPVICWPRWSVTWTPPRTCSSGASGRRWPRYWSAREQ